MNTILIYTIFLFSIICQVQFLYYIIKTHRSKNLTITDTIGYYFYIVASALSCTALFYMSINHKSISVSIITSLIILLSILPLINLRGVLIEIMGKKEIEDKVALLSRKDEIERKYYMMMNEYEENLSKLRHDFANQVQVAYGLVEEQKNINQSQVKELLDELQERIESTRVEAFCYNRFVNMLLTVKKAELEEKKIVLKTDIMLERGLYIENIDLCGMLITLFDEVLSGCIKIDKNYNHEVSLKMKINNRVLACYCSMPYQNRNELTNDEQLSMDNRREKLKKITEKYNGMVNFIEEDDRLMIVVTMREEVKW